jgi:hypothetical protein
LVFLKKSCKIQPITDPGRTLLKTIIYRVEICFTGRKSMALDENPEQKPSVEDFKVRAKDFEGFKRLRKLSKHAGVGGITSMFD